MKMLLLLLIVLFAAGCAPAAPPPTASLPTLTPTTPSTATPAAPTLTPTPTRTQTLTPSPTPEGLRILALGDSYTIGQSVATEERFPNQLVQALREDGYPMADALIIAQTGWTTGELGVGILRARIEGQTFDLVTLLIGVNNEYRGLPIDQYRDEFRRRLSEAIVFAGNNPARVIVLSIPDYGVTPVGQSFNQQRITQSIDGFNAVNLEETGLAGARYVDITPISREARDDPGLIAMDGLHPSGAMYARWVELLLPEAEAILSVP